jgi:pimeloyl-ACP methyl ester carboxylesterase
MGVDFLDDIIGTRARLNLLSAARRLHSPWLVVHGSADETVPFTEAEELAAAGGGRARLADIDGAGHTFGAVHPFAGPTPHLEAALAATLDHLHAVQGVTLSA